jgi:hypothetical protein
LGGKRKGDEKSTLSSDKNRSTTRKYDENYTSFGFMGVYVPGIAWPQCVDRKCYLLKV